MGRTVVAGWRPGIAPDTGGHDNEGWDIVGLLRPYEQKRSGATDADDVESNSVESASDVEGQPQRKGQTPKKGRPTKSRAEAEAERMARLHPNLSPKELRKLEREAKWERREAAYAKQQGAPERALMRDYVDSRWTISEFVLPIMMVFIALSFAFPRNVTIQSIVMAAMLALLVSWFANVWIFWRRYKKEATERLANPNFRGVLLEMNSRMMSIRRFRNPAPRVNRGDAY